ncbi:tripartite tricarboxylate transporter permease [Vibrio metschnikovii]
MLGIQPGPLLFTQHPETAWGLIASLFVANIILAFVNIPLAGVLVRMLAIPANVLYPIVLGLAFVGCYAIGNSVVDFYILILLGIVGFIMHKLVIPTAPMILAVIVGSQMEQSFRQAFRISNQEFSIFVQSGITQFLLIVTIFSICWPLINSFRNKSLSNMA